MEHGDAEPDVAIILIKLARGPGVVEGMDFTQKLVREVGTVNGERQPRSWEIADTPGQHIV